MRQLVAIPKGNITLRDDRIGKSWPVALAPFSISRYPVTRSFYAAITGQAPPSALDGDHPVESVSWLDAARFCNQLSMLGGLPDRYVFSSDGQDASVVVSSTGFRLPTEAEWEFACRAGTEGPRYAGIDDSAWYRDNSGGRPQAVGSKHPNDWGLHDMLGNVWEWCEDVYDPEAYGSYRIFRGGGWADTERGCLATNRRRSHPTFAIDDLGFRIARSGALT